MTPREIQRFRTDLIISELEKFPEFEEANKLFSLMLDKRDEIEKRVDDYIYKLMRDKTITK